MINSIPMDKKIMIGLKEGKGIVDVCLLLDQDREKILKIEKEAQETSFMGLGNVINKGVEDVLDCELVYVALTNMEFEWGEFPSLVMKKGHEIVGEEILDKERISKVQQENDVWLMGGCFVVYKDKVEFPYDILKKVCHFETPSIPVKWCTIEDSDSRFRCHNIKFSHPATPTDLFLKHEYFGGTDEAGFGTILIGVRLLENEESA
jgi:hypothetical protein